MGERDDQLCLMVELDPTQEPISGRIRDAEGRWQTFSGWLDLMDALDGARKRVEPETIDDTSDAPGGTE